LKACIVSLKYHPGHFSHLTANYLLFKELGIDSLLLINEEFKKLDLENSLNIINQITLSQYCNYKVVIIWFPNLRNIIELLKFKIFGKANIVYVFHEPINSYLDFYKSGFNCFKILTLFFVNAINIFTILFCSHIILPSKKALDIYQKKYKFWNTRFSMIPLLFDDENKNPNSNLTNKIYISYIGTIASDHAFNKFCNYIIFAIENNLFKQYSFLIATGSTINSEIKKKLLRFQNSGRLLISDGNWLSNVDINKYFNLSALIWNAYDRSNQSGILPKAFMFCTPVLGNAMIPNEYIIHRHNGFYLKDNSSTLEITNAINEITENLENYSKKSRETFLSTFYYQNYKKEFTKIINNE
jgi:hypothetical protein